MNTTKPPTYYRLPVLPTTPYDVDFFRAPPAIHLRFHRQAAIITPCGRAPRIHLHLSRGSFWRLRRLSRSAQYRWQGRPPGAAQYSHLWHVAVWTARPINTRRGRRR